MHLRLAIPLVLAACSAQPALIDPQPTLLGRTLALSVRGPDQQRVLVLESREGDARHPLVQAHAVRLQVAGGPIQDLPFVAAERVGDEVWIRCAAVPEHDIRVRVKLDGTEGMIVQVQDKIGLRSSVQELSIAYALLGDEKVSEVFTPHVQGPPSTLVGDDAFHLPMAFVRRGPVALAVVADVQTSGRSRRMPQGFQVDAAKAAVRHGLFATAEREDDGPAWFRSSPTGISVRGEDIGFAHTVRVRTGAGATLLSSAVESVWLEVAKPQFLDPERIAAVPTFAQARKMLGHCLQQQFKTATLSGIPVGYLPEPDGSGGIVLASFRVKRQDLLVARALLEHSPSSDPEAQARDLDRAHRLIHLALALPRRAGMPALQVVREGDNQEAVFVFTDPRPGTEVVPAIDAAWTGYHLLRLAERLPDLRERIHAACRATAGFLIDNQMQSGVIPSYYEPVHLAPRLDLVADTHGDTALLALFLAEFSRATGSEPAEVAARKALRFLEGIDPNGRWPDTGTHLAVQQLERLEASESEHLRPSPSSSFVIYCGALASLLQLDAAPASETMAFSGRLLDTLATFQQVWQPPWRPDAVIGGLTRTNVDTAWSPPGQAIAALAFCIHHQRTGRIQDLRRGVAVLRAELQLAKTKTKGSLLQIMRLSSALLVAAELRPSIGSAVIDLAAGEGFGVDGVTVSEVRVEQSTVSFALDTQVVDRGPVDLRFKGLRSIVAPVTVVCNGQSLGVVTKEELEDGLRHTPRLLPAVHFDPPRRLRIGSTSRLLVRTTPREAVTAVQLEWLLDGVQVATSDLSRDIIDPALWSLQTSPPTEVLRATGTIWLRAVARGYGVVRAPFRGSVPVTFGALDEIRLGTDPVMELLDDGDAPIVPFLGGDGVARALLSEPLVLRIPVTARATVLQLDVRAAGPIEIRAGDDLRNLVHADEDDTERADRVITLRLGDRRLWADGVLTLALRRPANSTDVTLVKTIRYAEEALADLPPGELRTDPVIAAVDELRVLLLPVTMPEAPVSASRTAFEQALLGGSGYRSTPPPKARRTSGSARELMAQLSGRRTRLVGRVLDPLSLPLETIPVSGTGEEVAEALAEAAFAHIQPEAGEILVVIHGSDLPALAERVIVSGGRTAVILPERVPLTSKRQDAGSFLPSGDLLDGLLRARFGLSRRDTSATGRFGSLAINANGDGHLPAGLLGIDLVQAGFADLVRIGPDDGPMRLELTPPLSGRTAVVLSHTDLPGRGDLYIEVHGTSIHTDVAAGSGLLLYWDLQKARPLLTLGTARSEPVCLRLSADSWLLPLDAPFVEGGEADLLARADRLDGDSTPSLATPQGDLLFVLRGLTLTGQGRAVVELRPTSQNLLRGRASFQAEIGDRAVRLFLDATSPLGGHAVSSAEGLALGTPPVPGASTVAMIPLAPVAGPARLFGVCQSEQTNARLVLSVDDREILTLEPRATDTPFCVELPLGISEGATLRLRAVAGTIGGDTVHVSSLRLVPRTPSLHRLPIGLGAPMPVRLQDGILYARTLVLTPGSDPAFTAPLVLPGRRAMLRVLAGLPDAPSENKGGEESSLTIRIRAGDGSVLVTPLQDEVFKAGPGNLRTILMEIPEAVRGAYRIEFTVRGSTPLHVVDVAVDRK